ncbi:MAG: hypothetical protein WHS90_02250 [Caldilinea sp.]|uniref:hypothetical protein n=1 Tax=Caldilinea sp. TaxID=2293560 RepID=UPI0030A0093F
MVLENRLDFGGLAEDGDPALEKRKERCVFRTKHSAYVRLRVGADHCQKHTGIFQRPQHLVDASKQSNLVDLLRHTSAHLDRHGRHLPHAHAEMLHQAARVVAAQVGVFGCIDALEAIAVGELIDHARRPGKRVGQRAVEVEDDELVVCAQGLAPFYLVKPVPHSLLESKVRKLLCSTLEKSCQTMFSFAL